MDTELITLFMMGLYLSGFLFIVIGGVRFLRNASVLMNGRHMFANGVVLAAAASFFVGGMAVHFTGSSNTSFLRGQKAQTSSCELGGETAHPEARRNGSVIGSEIVACMRGAGFAWTDELSQCKDAPVATNPYCYLPAAWFDRGITRMQIAFD